MTILDPDDSADPAAALADALDQGAEGGEELTEIRQLVLNELKRRLSDPKSAADLPGTGMLQLATHIAKADAERAKQPVAQEHVQASVLEMVRTAGLPNDRRRELLVRELERVDFYAAELANELEALDGTTAG